MKRVPEPELMDSEEQVRAYAEADFSEPHDRFVVLFRETFPDAVTNGQVLDLGCGPADVTIRFAKAFPGCSVDGIDAGPNMVALGRENVRRAGLDRQIRLLQGRLPLARPPKDAYDVVICNSLLHHLSDPGVLWESIRRYARGGAPVFVVDLARPSSVEELDRLVALYVAGEPEVLRNDFHNSLMASYRPDEVRAQLAEAGLCALTVCALGDRHLSVSGYAPGR